MRARLWLLLCAAVFLFGCGKSPEERLAAHKNRAVAYQAQGKIDEAVIELRNAVQIAPKDVEALYELAELQLSTGRAQEAFKSLRQVVELEPGHVDAQLRLGNLYLLGNSPEEAWARADSAIELAPDRAEGHLLLGQVLVRMGAVDEGLAALDRAIQLAPGEVGPQLTKAAALVAGNRPTEARPILETILKDDASSKGALFLLVRVAELEGDAGGVRSAVDRLLEGASEDPAAWMIYGNYLASVGQPGQAVEAYRKAADLDPSATTAWEKMAEMALARGDRPLAEEAIAAILAKDPMSPAGLLARAQILLSERKFSEAEALVQQVLTDSPNSPEARYSLGAAYYGQGRLAPAQKELQGAVELNPKLLRARLLLAQVHLDLRQFDLALSVVGPVFQPGQVPLDAVMIRGTALLGQRKAAEAREDFQRVVQVMPSNARAHEGVGLSYLIEQRTGEALKSFGAATTAEPSYLPPLARSVQILTAEGKSEQAGSLVRDHMGKAGESAGARELLGRVYAAQGDRQRARGELERAVELDPGAVGAYLLLAQLHQGPGATEEALADVEKAIAARPNHLQGWMLKGMLHDQRGEPDEANLAYRKLLELDGNHVPALNNLAWNLSKPEGNLDEALRFAEKAVGLAPTQPAANDTLGWVYARRGVYRKALQHLEIAASGLPESPEVQYHLGVAYAGLEDRPRAVAALEKALRLSQDFDGAAEARELLAKLKEKP